MITAELLIIFILIALNGILAMSEIAIISSRKERLQQLASEGNSRAQAALDLANEPNRFLSTIQIGITLIGVLAGAFGGITIAGRLGELFNTIPFINPYGATVGLTVVVIAITYLTVVFGEIVPKRLALIFPENIASFVARPMLLLSKIASPAVKIFSYSTDVVLKILGIKEVQERHITEEEILLLLEQGEKAGTVEEEEKSIVDNVFNLTDRQVGSLMTSRNQIVSLDLENTIEENTRIINESIHSIFPLCKGGLENIIGVIHAKSLLSEFVTRKITDLSQLADQPLFIPETMKAFKALELFKKSGKHFAFVVDEYGVVQGLLTIIDIFEALVGDIPTIEEIISPLAVQREDGTWLLDGLFEIDDFKKLFEIDELPDEDSGDYNTIGGFVIYQMEKIPIASEYFDWNGFRIEVVDMDGNRVDKVLLTKK
ncbi:MAG: hypothetical protein A2Y25_04270 [Candidatus Melainabacteria bacterium GWF2_37_15]|nr:MAG: hypothetical protein A2Y25_04270 [Candidatus Melainabacteria bacterium GWF2_37_15]